jgi:hypothetical protein
MAAQTINGITLNYPNDPCTVFNPCVFRLTGTTLARSRVTITSGGKTYTATYQTPKGGALDLRQFLQVLFDGLTLGADLEQITDSQVSELGKSVTITIEALAADNTVIATFSRNIFCIWGATKSGEDFERITGITTRHITWFTAFPLTVGLYINLPSRITLYAYTARPDDGGQIKNINFANKGLYNVVIDDDGGANRNYIGIDNTDTLATNFIIKIDREHNEGIYLRWIDRHGFWCYWLFKAGDPTRTAASKFGAWYRNNIANYDQFIGWYDGAGRRQSYTRNDVQPICAPLVDSETFDYLQDITTSPVVDMFLGYDDNDRPMWVTVTVEPGQYTKNVDKPEQDFICNILLPEIPTQTL